MITIIAKNQTASQITITDLGGCIIDASGQYELTKSRGLNAIYSSKDLVTMINDDTILLNDGTTDFTKAESLTYIAQFNTYNPVAQITLKSPNGTAWYVSVDNDGVLTTAQ